MSALTYNKSTLLSSMSFACFGLVKASFGRWNGIRESLKGRCHFAFLPLKLLLRLLVLPFLIPRLTIIVVVNCSARCVLDSHFHNSLNVIKCKCWGSMTMSFCMNTYQNWLYTVRVREARERESIDDFKRKIFITLHTVVNGFTLCMYPYNVHYSVASSSLGTLPISINSDFFPFEIRLKRSTSVE